MKHLPGLFALAWAACTASAAGPPVGPLVPAPQRTLPLVGPLVPVPQPTFHSLAELFSWIAVDRRLGDGADQALLAQLQADSRVEHLRDGAAQPVTVVRVDLLNADGTSRARSPDGNYTFYVLRETPGGMQLLGRMFGWRYDSHLADRHLEFEVELHISSSKTVPMHFRVTDGALENLSPLPGTATPPVIA
jgi:hypothetical protein